MPDSTACHRCGSPLEPAGKFCGSCGAPVVAVQEAAAAPGQRPAGEETNAGASSELRHDGDPQIPAVAPSPEAGPGLQEQPAADSGAKADLNALLAARGRQPGRRCVPETGAAR
jgi:hypothetical protein